MREAIGYHPSVPAGLLLAYERELTALAGEFPAQAATLRWMLGNLQFRQRLLASLDEPVV